MENKRPWAPGSQRGWEPGLGPSRPAPSRPLSAARERLLAAVRDQAEPVTQAALVQLSGLHANTVRDHLDGLVRQGLVRRERATPQGRGRPAWLYAATGAEPGGSEYAGLAATLAATLARTSEDPRSAAETAGGEWGRDLARDRGAEPGSDPEQARDRVVRLLDDLGFGTRTSDEEPERVRLTRCPLLEAAHRHPDVVCGVHLGLVRGALEANGADPTGSALVPFAEPGACLLVVPPLPGGR